MHITVNWNWKENHSHMEPGYLNLSSHARQCPYHLDLGWFCSLVWWRVLDRSGNMWTQNPDTRARFLSLLCYKNKPNLMCSGEGPMRGWGSQPHFHSWCSRHVIQSAMVTKPPSSESRMKSSVWISSSETRAAQCSPTSWAILHGYRLVCIIWRVRIVTAGFCSSRAVIERHVECIRPP